MIKAPHSTHRTRSDVGSCITASAGVSRETTLPLPSPPSGREPHSKDGVRATPLGIDRVGEIRGAATDSGTEQETRREGRRPLARGCGPMFHVERFAFPPRGPCPILSDLVTLSTRRESRSPLRGARFALAGCQQKRECSAGGRTRRGVRSALADSASGLTSPTRLFRARNMDRSQPRSLLRVGGSDPDGRVAGARAPPLRLSSPLPWVPAMRESLHRTAATAFHVKPESAWAPRGSGRKVRRPRSNSPGAAGQHYEVPCRRTPFRPPAPHPGTKALE